MHCLLHQILYDIGSAGIVPYKLVRHKRGTVTRNNGACSCMWSDVIIVSTYEALKNSQRGCSEIGLDTHLSI
jgi:hypothetical protein